MNAATLQRLKKLEASLYRKRKMGAMRAKFRKHGLWSEWTMDGACSLAQTLESLPADLYCKRKRVTLDQTIFLFRGRRLREGQTPRE